MMKNPSMQILVPFIIQNIEKNYRSIVINGALKKNLYIMILDALFKNPKVNLEYHVFSYFFTNFRNILSSVSLTTS